MNVAYSHRTGEGVIWCNCPHPRNDDVPDDVNFTKFGTALILTYVTTSAIFGCYRLKGGHSSVVQSLRLTLSV